MSQTAAHLVDHVIAHVPVRLWVLSLPIPLRGLLAAQPELVTAVLQVVRRAIARHLLDAGGLEADEGHGGAVTLIQRFGSAANLDIHLQCLVLDGVYRRDAEGRQGFVEAVESTDDELHALLQSVTSLSTIARWLAVNSAPKAPPSEVANSSARCESAACITARKSSMRCSSIGTPSKRSDSPCPRLSKTMTRKRRPSSAMSRA
jgi:hypothetical protein